MSGFFGPSTPGLVELSPELKEAVHSESGALVRAMSAREQLIVLLIFLLFGASIVGLLALSEGLPSPRRNLSILVSIGACLAVMAKRLEPPRRSHVRALVIELGFCPECGYDLTGLQSDRCPECGWLVPDTVGRRLRPWRAPPAEREALLRRFKARQKIRDINGGLARAALGLAIASPSIFILLAGVVISQTLNARFSGAPPIAHGVYWLVVVALAGFSGVRFHHRILRPAEERTRQTVCEEFRLCSACFDRPLKAASCSMCGRQSDQYAIVATPSRVECTSRVSSDAAHD